MWEWDSCKINNFKCKSNLLRCPDKIHVLCSVKCDLTKEEWKWQGLNHRPPECRADVKTTKPGTPPIKHQLYENFPDIQSEKKTFNSHWCLVSLFGIKTGLTGVMIPDRCLILIHTKRRAGSRLCSQLFMYFDKRY